MRAAINDLVAAFSVLTRLPLPGRLTGKEPPNQPRSVWAYPLVGGVTGGIGVLVLLALYWAGLNGMLAAGIAVAVQILFTGALHEDGLADVADGFGGGRDKAQKLKIMRDSRLGTYGAIALIFVLGLRWASIAALPQAQAAAGLIVAGILARFTIVAILAALPAARGDGFGRVVANPPLFAVGIAAASAILATALALPPSAAVIAAAAMIAATVFTIWLARRNIAGYTGDVLGAGAASAETVVLMALAHISTGL